MRLSIMFKSTAVLIFSILIGSLAIFFISRHFMHDGFDHSIHAQLLTVRQVVDGTYAHAKKALLQEAKMLASEKELTEAIKGNNKQAISDFAKTAMKQCEANFVMILDSQGIALARGHSPNSGDSFAEFDIVRVALSGQALAEAVDLKKSGLSVGAAAPIRSDGKQIGVILLGNAFHTHAFVDEIKKITGMEMTIFDGDQRISTTITNNGQRAVGTKLNNPAVQSAVLQNGTTYAAPANILGKAYRTVYWPIKESSGKILGMWFIGTSVEVVEKTVDDIAFYCFIAVLVVVVVLSLLGFLFFRNLVTPLKHSVNYAKAVSEGDLDATLFVKPRKDEVGDLVQALQHMDPPSRRKSMKQTRLQLKQNRRVKKQNRPCIRQMRQHLRLRMPNARACMLPQASLTAWCTAYQRRPMNSQPRLKNPITWRQNHPTVCLKQQLL